MDKPQAKERRVVGYLHPTNAKFIKNYATIDEVSVSKVMNEAANALKKSMSPEQVARIMNPDRNRY